MKEELVQGFGLAETVPAIDFWKQGRDRERDHYLIKKYRTEGVE